ncbi:MAG: hypothetical protein Pyrs2KO_25110 [Pyruvatibacter sp.]
MIQLVLVLMLVLGLEQARALAPRAVWGRDAPVAAQPAAQG